MAVNTMTHWAASQFGEDAGQVARRVVQALSDAQEVGTRTQRASGMTKRYPYGSTWVGRYEQMIYQFTEAEGHDLLDVAVIKVAKAPYDLVAINGHLLVPFLLARSLADVPDHPMLSSDVLRATTAGSVPAPIPPPGLFDVEDGRIREQPRLPQPRSALENSSSAATRSTGAGASPVFIGVVCNADTDRLLGLWWGNAESIDETGVITWSPEPLSLELGISTDGLRAVTDRDELVHRDDAFDQGAVPQVVVTARPQPVAPNPAAEPPSSRVDDPRDAVGELGD